MLHLLFSHQWPARTKNTYACPVGALYTIASTLWNGIASTSVNACLLPDSPAQASTLECESPSPLSQNSERLRLPAVKFSHPSVHARPNSLIQAFTLGCELLSLLSQNSERLRLPVAKASDPSVHAWVEIAITITIAPERQAPAHTCRQTLLLKRLRLGVDRHRDFLKTTSACACLLPNYLIQAFTLGWKLPSPSSHNGKRLRLPAKFSHPSVHARPLTQAFTLGWKLPSPSPSPQNGKRLRTPAAKLSYSSVYAWVWIAIAIFSKQRAPALACCQIISSKRSRLGGSCHHHHPTTASACACLPPKSLTQAFTLGWKLPSPSPQNDKRLRSPAAELSYSSVHAWVEIAITISPERQAPALACCLILSPKRPRLGGEFHHHHPASIYARLPSIYSREGAVRST
ncbi:hypothetical protein C8R48DRAFT_782801 [Suillus tomentosus]|nr:hypothetical protein C8R48DRAFT_782801 [Suillus tomentosus]